MRTATAIRQHLVFRNSGPDQTPGLIVMELADATGDQDRRHRGIVVLFNARDETILLADPAFAGRRFHLHPAQEDSHDPVVRTARFEPAQRSFSVPARTAAVFVEPRAAADRVALLVRDVEGLIARGLLGAGPGNALRAKLQAALASLARGQEGAAGRQLAAFVDQVEALVRSGHLPGVEGNALIGEAQEIRERIED